MMMLNGSVRGVPRRIRRQHGFQLPLHPFQVSAWLGIAALTAGSFVVLVPALPHHAQPPFLAALAVLLLLHILAHLTAALQDPAEAQLRARRPRREVVPELDRAKYSHVIEDGLCHLCRIQVSSVGTKHCSACNKCVDKFDHHCKWLNHCVGGRNYAAFLMCVATAVVGAALVAVLAVTQLAFHYSHWIDTDRLQGFFKADNTTAKPTTSSLPSSDAAFLAVVAALGILAAITAALLLHLCFFHIYISFLGLTTYEYIRQQRQSPQPAETRVEPTSNGCSVLRHRPANLQYGSRTTFFSCTVVEETLSGLGSGCRDPTPTPPSTPQDCQVCLTTTSNTVAPSDVSHHPHARKYKTKWNCCLAVPDSPDSPSEPRCLMNICKNKMKAKKVDGRAHGHWSSTKLRVLFRIMGNLGQNRRRTETQLQLAAKSNQVVPVSDASRSELIQTVNNLVPIPLYPEVQHRANTLPALPSRRRLINESELANALAALQQQQRCARRHLGHQQLQYRRRKRSLVHRPKTPTLSPIRESGLSNPASPSHQSCSVGALSATCIRPA